MNKTQAQKNIQIAPTYHNGEYKMYRIAYVRGAGAATGGPTLSGVTFTPFWAVGGAFAIRCRRLGGAGVGGGAACGAGLSESVTISILILCSSNQCLVTVMNWTNRSMRGCLTSIHDLLIILRSCHKCVPWPLEGDHRHSLRPPLVVVYDK